MHARPTDEVPRQARLRQHTTSDDTSRHQASDTQGWHPLGPDTGIGSGASDQKYGSKKALSHEHYDAVSRQFTVQRAGEWAGRGEDHPIEHVRMARDGWRQVAEGQAGTYGDTKGFSWLMHQRAVHECEAPVIAKHSEPLILARELKAIGQAGGSWYAEDFVIRTTGGQELRRITDCSWADWHHDGDLLFAVSGCLYRLPRARTTELAANPLDGAMLIADLTPLRFTPTLAPAWATQWE